MVADPTLRSWFDDTLFGYATIQKEGDAAPQQTTLNLIGDGVTVVDNPTTGATDVTIAGGSGGYFVTDTGATQAQIHFTGTDVVPATTAIFAELTTQIGTADSFAYIQIDGTGGNPDDYTLSLGAGGASPALVFGGTAGIGARWTKAYRSVPKVGVVAGATACPLTDSNVIELTISSAGAVTFVNGDSGSRYVVRIKNYQAGPPTFPGLVWRGGADPVWSTTVNAIDRFVLDIDGAGNQFASAFVRGDDTDTVVRGSSAITIHVGASDVLTFGAGAITWAASATGAGLAQAAHASGDGAAMTLTPQRGHTAGTHRSGPLNVELGPVVAGASSRMSLLVSGASVLDISQTGSGVVTIQPAASLVVGGTAVTFAVGALSVESTATNIDLSAYGGDFLVKAGASRTVRLRVTNAGLINLENATSAGSASAGAGSALPATPEGYVSIQVNGTTRKIPYYPV